MATTSPRATRRPTTLATTERDLALNGLFSTALEGGIGYWSACSVYHWGIDVDGRLREAKDFIAVVEDSESEDGPEYVIDRHVIRIGAARLYRHLIGLGEKANAYHLAAMRDFARGNWADLDYDADTADLVVQFGLFGELVYN
jgi:hypothetical protein